MYIIFIDENENEKKVKLEELDASYQIVVKHYLRDNPKTEIVKIDSKRNKQQLQQCCGMENH